MELSIGDSAGRYLITDLLANHGLYRVFLGYDPQLFRNVAIKVRSDGYAGDSRSCLLNEARILAQLEHPAIVKTHDAGKLADGGDFIVLDFLSGGSLSKMTQTQQSTETLKQTCNWLATIADAVDYVHSCGYLHRNLKPNVILFDRSNRPYLTSFFLALERASWQTAFVAGTPAFMAPEQCRANAELSPQSDIWGLGATLYRILSGHIPFSAASVLEMMDLISAAELVPPSQRNPAVPNSLDRICSRCMEKNPKDRYESAAEFAEELRAWCFS